MRMNDRFLHQNPLLSELLYVMMIQERNMMLGNVKLRFKQWLNNLMRSINYTELDVAEQRIKFSDTK